MNIKETIGIDISKATFDVRIHSNQKYESFENKLCEFKNLLKWVSKNSSFSTHETLFIFEHTGLYSYQISVFLTDQNIPFLIIPGLEIKRSLGIARGKDDKIDATKIALYGYRLRDELRPCKLPNKAITNLKQLLSLRERLVKQRSGFKASLKELKHVLSRKDNTILFETQEKMVKELSKQIDKIELVMQNLIKEESELNEIYKLVSSVKGIGPQTTLFLIAFTEGFTKFENARKFASYCGIAPFPNSSGISIRGRTKVSNLANKKLKSLLDLCAKTAIQHSPEMKIYYHKRIDEGKNKMSTINIIRNKLLARAFAVVRRRIPYVDTWKFAA
jgi:transposase